MRHYDYDEFDARDAAYDSRQDAIEAGECVCRVWLGPWLVGVIDLCKECYKVYRREMWFN